jgi:cell division protein FtsB
MRLLIGVLALAVLYLVFEFGRIQAGYNVVDAAAQRGGLKAEIASLEAETGRLEEQIVMLETEAEIERVAYKDVEASLVELQAKIQEQQDAIAFYRGIVSPADGNA